MKTIIAGSRDITNYNVLLKALDESFMKDDISEIVCGKAKGVDTLGERYGKENNIPVIPFPAEWDKYGNKSAGPIRNRQMAEYADRALVIWDGKSPGSKNMIKTMKQLKKEVFEYIYKE